jgi:hypothetical protein
MEGVYDLDKATFFMQGEDIPLVRSATRPTKTPPS